MKIKSLNLEFVRTIEATEFAILSEYKLNNRVFLEKLCSKNSNGLVYLVVESSKEKVDKYLHRLISMRELLNCDQDVLCWIIEKTGETITSVSEVNMNSVPSSYIPTALSFYEEI